jgi:hypothetical protein
LDPVPDHDPSPRPGKRPRLNPAPLTAAAAMVDAQREMQDQARSNLTSPNPANEVLNTLMGASKQAVSSVSDGSNNTQAGQAAATSISEPLAVVAENIQQTPSETMQVDSTAQTSPASLSSLGTLESTTAPITTASNNIASPAPLDTAQDEGEGKSAADSTSPDEGNKAFSYPGTHLQAHLTEGRRGMSLPHSGLRHESPRSPSNKKHRCPYCATEFTRHHNLKSHLLTHSQDKPYVCRTSAKNVVASLLEVMLWRDITRGRVAVPVAEPVWEALEETMNSMTVATMMEWRA